MERQYPRQREQLAYKLREPLTRLGEQCTPAWGDRVRPDDLLLHGLADVPYCDCLYALGTDGVQISDNISSEGIVSGHYARDRSQRPYMKEQVPASGFLLSDAYISLLTQRPALTALQVVRSEHRMLGYIGADFDLRDLPVTSELYEEPATGGDQGGSGHQKHRCFSRRVSRVRWTATSARP